MSKIKDAWQIGEIARRLQNEIRNGLDDNQWEYGQQEDMQEICGKLDIIINTATDIECTLINWKNMEE